MQKKVFSLLPQCKDNVITPEFLFVTDSNKAARKFVQTFNPTNLLSVFAKKTFELIFSSKCENINAKCISNVREIIDIFAATMYNVET